MLSARSHEAETEEAAGPRHWGVLMACAQSGDQQAYRHLLAEVTPYLRRLARRRVGQQEVDDAVQDILLSLHRIRHTYDPSRPFKPWLVTIAQRRLVDRLRRRLRQAAYEDAMDDDVTTVAHPANSHENVLDIRALRRAVDDLPERQKEAVVLLRLKEMTGKDAAAMTGRPEGALKVSLHRAIRSLRRILVGD